MRGPRDRFFSFLTFCWTNASLRTAPFSSSFVVAVQSESKKYFTRGATCLVVSMSYSRPPNNFTPSLLLNAHEARHARLSMLGNIAAHPGPEPAARAPSTAKPASTAKDRIKTSQVNFHLHSMDKTSISPIFYTTCNWNGGRYERERK